MVTEKQWCGSESAQIRIMREERAPASESASKGQIRNQETKIAANLPENVLKQTKIIIV